MVCIYPSLEINVASSFDEILRRRLEDIQDQGVSQTIFIKDRLAQQEAERQGLADINNQKLAALTQIRSANRANQLLAENAPQFIQTGGNSVGGSGNNGGSSGGGPKGSFGNFLQAIQAKESGGRYSARNPSSGAMGKYQIMPGNIQGSGGWDKEALGRNVSVGQFMNSPEIQDAIARYKLQQYYNKYGAAGAAVAWYAGPGNAKKYVASGGKGFNRKQGKYPSVSSYARDILRRMGYS